MSEEVVQSQGTEIQSPTPQPPPAAEAATTEVTVSKSMEPELTPEAPAYTPNLKYKVNMEEREFDQWLHPVIKDADTEKKLRKLYEDAYGLEYVKPKYEAAQSRAKEYEQKYNDFHTQVSEIVGLRDKDFWGFMDALGLDKEKVAKHVLEEVKKLELPEDQKRIYDELEKTRRSNFQLEKQFQEEQARSQQASVQARTHELDTILTRPEISAYAKSYDTARKKSGAFKEAVVRYGISEWNVNQKDLGAEQAVFDTMSMLGEYYRGQQNPQVTQQSSDDKPLPVIPRVSGKAVSPTGKSPRSLEDLKKIAASFQE